MALGVSSPISTLTALSTMGALVMGVAGHAEAATPTYYDSLGVFQADVTATVTDPYTNPAYVFMQTNAQMSAVLGETDYVTTGFANWNIVTAGYYCAGCNGSFELSFQTTSMGNADGVNAVGVSIQFHDLTTPYYAYITFADGTTANVPLPVGGSFWGVAAPERVERIHFGLSMGGTTQAGAFGISDLIVGDYLCEANSECPDEGNPCTDHVCLGGLCQLVFNVSPCEDGDACSEGEVCAAGVCQGGAPVACDDTNPCTDDSCDPDLGCTYVDNIDPCDDGDACSEDDVCTAGVCQGAPVACDDANPCTNDGCDPGTGCTAIPNTDPCDDADPCTELDACSAGACGGVALDCNDDDPCTANSCDPTLGCVGEPIAGCCLADGDCGVEETCDPVTHTCVPIPSGSSSDGGTSSGGESSESEGTTGTTGAGDTENTSDTSDTSDTGDTSDAADTSGTTTAASGVDDTGSGGNATSADTGSVDTGPSGSTSAEATAATDAGEVPAPGASCACTTSPSSGSRPWWLLIAVGPLLRRRRRA